MRIRRGGAILLVLLASCAQAGANPSTKAAGVISAPATTASVSPSTTVPTTEATPPPTAAQIGQPTTTTTAFISTEQRIAQIVVEHARQQIACFSAPTKCDVAAITAEQGTLRANMTIGVQAMIDRHYEAREDPADPSYINVSATNLAEDQRSAVVSVCVWDPLLVWEVHGVPDGSDALINSAKSTFYRTYTVFLEVGQWRVGQTSRLTEVKERNSCGPRT